MMDSMDALWAISRHRGDAIVVTTMTANAEWPQVTKNPAYDLPLSGAMGKASSLGLGLSLARPERRVLVLDGDGSLLMNLGSLVTIAHVAPPNLYHFVFQNNVYRVSGGQPVPGAGKFSFVALALAAGYAAAYDFQELEPLEMSLPQVLERPGPALICLQVPSLRERAPYPITPTSAMLSRFREALAKAKI
ncbi:MAG: thiamine pyrophosphate-binding protein [Chloroflexi bacterium]|nr:thiamine pyrophosphate-binding protein [Chloroflexota bacterium]